MPGRGKRRKAKGGKGEGNNGSRTSSLTPTPPPEPDIAPGAVINSPIAADDAHDNNNTSSGNGPVNGPPHRAGLVTNAVRSTSADERGEVSHPLVTMSVTNAEQGGQRSSVIDASHSAVRTPVSDLETETFVEQETRDLAENILPASVALEQQAAANTESAKRTMLTFDEELERRTVNTAFSNGRRAMQERELAEAEARKQETRSGLSSAASTPQRTRETSLRSPAPPRQSTQRFTGPAAAEGAASEVSSLSQTQQSYYGAAALPVESSSEALDRAANAARLFPGVQAAARGVGSRDRGAGGSNRKSSSATASTSSYSSRRERLPISASAAGDLPQPSSSGTRDPTYGRGSIGANAAAASLPRTERGGAREEEVKRARAFFWPLVVAPPLSHDEQQEAAYYLPFRDTHFYCYSLEEEMPALRAITVDQAVEAAAEGTLCTPATIELAPASSHYGAVDDTRSLSPRHSYGRQGEHTLSPHTPHSGLASHRADASYSSGLSLLPSMNVNGAEYAEQVLRGSGGYGGGGGAAGGAKQHVERYQLPQMRRIWATTVLRQFLLFSLSSMLFIVLFVPTVLCGSLLDIYSVAQRDGFYSARNRYGASANLSALELAVSEAVLLLVAVVALVVARHATRGLTHPGQGPLRTWFPLLSPRMLLLCGVGFVTAGSNLLFYAGVEERAVAIVVAKVLSGAGTTLAIIGIFAMACAEVGIAAGAVVVLAMMLPSWLIASAGSFYILPYVLDSWVTAGQVLNGITWLESSSLLFGLALALLLPADMLSRAAVVNIPYAAPQELRKAAKEVSSRFVLRVLSFSVLAATLLCLAICATPIMTQRSVSGGRVQSELVPVDPRHATSFMFIAALCAWPFCLVPTSAAWVNRCLPNSVLTLLLAGMWLAYAVLDPPSAMGGVGSVVFPAAPATTTAIPDTDAVDTTGLTKPLSGGGGKGGGKRAEGNSSAGNAEPVAPGALARFAGRLLTPSLCAMLTGIVFAVVAASVVRTIANSGATLPIHPRHKHHRRRRLNPFRRPHREMERGGDGSGLASDALLQSTLSHSSSVEARKVLSPPPQSAHQEETASLTKDGDSTNDGDMETVDCHSIRARFIFQRRGGPSAVLILTMILAVVCLLVCSLSQAVASALLTDLYRAPKNALDIADGVPMDMHQSLLWIVAGLTGLAAFFEVSVVAFGLWVNARRHHIEV